MSNNQNFNQKIMLEWQKHMQEYLTDPRVAELMADYYAKFQNQIKNVATAASESASNTNDASAKPSNVHELYARIDNLEQRVRILEQIISGMCK